MTCDPAEKMLFAAFYRFITEGRHESSTNDILTFSAASRFPIESVLIIVLINLIKSKLTYIYN